MTPTWVTIVVALGSGILATLLATLLRISHERDVEIRTRMLTAADDFVVDSRRAHRAIETLVALRYTEPEEDEFEARAEEERQAELATGVRAPEWEEPDDDELGAADDNDDDGPEPEEVWHEATIEALEASERGLKAADERVARLELLFGYDSAALAAAGRAVSSLFGAVSVAREIPRDPEELAWGLLREAGKREAEFNEAVRKELWQSNWARLGARVRGRAAAERRGNGSRNERGSAAGE